MSQIYFGDGGMTLGSDVDDDYGLESADSVSGFPNLMNCYYVKLIFSEQMTILLHFSPSVRMTTHQ